MEFLAKRNPDITILDHTKMVVNLSIGTAKRYTKNTSDTDGVLKKIAVAAILHDIGKYSKEFQSDIMAMDDEGLEVKKRIAKSKKVQNGYFHNSISWAFAYSCVNGLNQERYRPIRSAILYHHTVKDEMTSTSPDIIGDMIENDAEGLNAMKEHYIEMLRYVDEIFGLDLSKNPDFSLRSFSDTDELNSGSIESETVYPSAKLPGIKGTDFVKKLRKYQDLSYEMAIVRGIVVYADRAVSSNKYDNLRILRNDTDYISEIYCSHVETHYKKEPDFSGYSQSRLSLQMSIVDDIINGNKGIYDIAASAGFGKTLIGLIHHFKTGRKTMWVVPRIIIADGVYNSILTEIRKMGMSNEVRVARMYGGVFVDGDENCDIIVSVIDSFLSRYSKNNLSTFLIDSYFGDVIFDEYHEFSGEEPLFSAFLNTVYGRNKHSNAKTVFLSATGLENTLSSMLFGGDVELIKPPVYGGETEVEIHVVGIPDISESKIDSDTCSFTIMPTVGTAQDMYRRNDGIDRSLIHSRFTKEDRAEKEDDLYRMYGKNRTDEPKPIIGTNIIGTGLDISARSITHYMPSPDETIQIACGRSSRFKEYGRVKYTVLVCPSMRRFLGKIFDTELRYHWIDMLKNLDGKVVTKNELYVLRDKFYNDNRNKFRKFIFGRYIESMSSLSKIVYRNGGTVSNEEYDTVSKHVSYRGAPTSFYVTAYNENGELIKPISCDAPIIFGNENDQDGARDRYDYMIKNDSFPSAEDLKYIYGIRTWRDASRKKCSEFAWRSDCAMLLVNYRYSKEMGLYPIGTDEE